MSISATLIAPRYTVTSAARIVGISPSRARRWLATSPSYKTSLSVRAEAAGKDASFLDLVELFIASELVQHFGANTRALRTYLHEAAHLLKSDHPLATKSFYVEKDRLYVELGEQLVELGTGGQQAIEEVIATVGERVEFGEDAMARALQPRENLPSVTVSVGHGWGMPTVKGTRIPTSLILKYVDQSSVDAAARGYGLTHEQVQQAVEFELSLASKAA